MTDSQSPNRRIGKWLRVSELHPLPNAKTKRWSLENVDGTPLGLISWHGPWRCYVLEPYKGTIFHDACLRDIAAFLASVRAERVSASPESGIVYWFAETVDAPPRYAEKQRPGNPVELTADPLAARRFPTKADALAFICGSYARSCLPPLRPVEHMFMGPAK